MKVFYYFPMLGDSEVFSSKVIWNPWVLMKVGFFEWEATQGKILTLDRLKRSRVSLIYQTHASSSCYSWNFVAIGFVVIQVAVGDAFFNQIDVTKLKCGSKRKQAEESLVTCLVVSFMDHLE